jgi:Tfp pilus assembly protein PilX
VKPLWYLNPAIVGSAGGGVLTLMGFSMFAGWRYLAQRRESARLRDQMLEQEHAARVSLEEANTRLQQARKPPRPPTAPREPSSPT